MLQTILGSGGAVGRELARSLTEYTGQIRLVSRNPEKINETDELMPADLLDPVNVDKAVEGSAMVYVTIGFPYSYKFWKEHWLAFMQSVIGACEKHGAKLIFFDNIYMYNPSGLAHLTEETPVGPVSRKGEVRRQVARAVMDAAENGSVRALIARSADFYGPGIKDTSVLTQTVFDPLSMGKKANWMDSVKYRHSYTYTPDAGKATALLGNTDDAYNQVWHLPTAPEPPTGEEFIRMIAEGLGVKPGYRLLSKTLVRIFGIFSPIMRELPEMMYQYDRDYVFISDKFEKRFRMHPTSYSDGIRAIIEADYRSGN